MNEKRFTFGAVSPNVAMIKDNGEPMDIGEVVDRLNKQQITIQSLKEENEKLKHYKLYEDNKRLQIIIADLKKENEQLRQQIQNYEKLISNSYVGEEETLDGFVGKYVIWENELQKYKNKNGD